MTYIIDTHILVWFLGKSKRLSRRHYNILIDKDNSFVLPAIVLAEIKYLIWQRRVGINFDEVKEYIRQSENCVIHPIDEDAIDEMPAGFSIHDALIVATGLVYKNIIKEDVKILTEDEEITNSGILPVI